MGRVYQVRQTMPNGTTYVYECEDEYSPEHKQTRKKYRKLIGKLDEDGNIVPTRKKSMGTPKQESTTQELRKSERENKALALEVERLTQNVKELQRKNKKYENVLHKIQQDIASVM